MTRRLVPLVVVMAAAASTGMVLAGRATDQPRSRIRRRRDVVGSPDEVALGRRVRDLSGVRSVSVSVGSGMAPVTVVVAEGFSG